MKSRKYILIVLAFLTSLLCTVGASLWVVLTDKIVELIPYEKITPTVTAPTISNAVYYGENVTPTGGTATVNGISINGTWSVDTYISTSGTSPAISTMTTCTFNPTNSKLYNQAIVSTSITMNTVATYGGSHYTTIDGALTKANEKNTGIIYVTPITDYATQYKDGTTGNNVLARTITDKIEEIFSNVTLILPYSGTTYKNRENSLKATDFADAKESTYLKNFLSIADGHTLANKGTIIVGGVLGSATESGNQGHTSGNYAQINMGENSHIQNSGTIDCYGFIKETSKGKNKSFIYNTGTINAPFVIYDYRGPRHTIGSYQAGPISPFAIYDMPNIYSQITTTANAQIMGYVDLFTEGDAPIIGYIAQHNLEHIAVFHKSDAVINLTDNATAIIDYTTTASPNKSTIGKTYITISGGATSGSLTLNVSLMNIINETVDMSAILFPVSWKIDITLTNGIYNLNSQYKFMPGSKLTISESAIANISDNIIFYTSDYSSSYYPAQNTDASFIIDGTVNITAGSFGGYVTAGKNKAILNISTKSLSLTSKEGTGNLSNTYSGTFTESGSVTEKATADINNSGTINEDSDLSTGFYQSDGTTWTLISNPRLYTIKLNYNYDGATESSYSILLEDDQDSVIVTNVFASDPVRAHWEFTGWYTDAECKNPIEDNETTTSLGESITVYAGWKEIEYTLYYNVIYDDGTSSDSIYDSVKFKYSDLSSNPINLPSSPPEGSASTLKLIGWSFSLNTTSNLISVIDATTNFVKHVDGDTIHLYAMITEMYTVIVNPGKDTNYNGGNLLAKKDGTITTELPILNDQKNVPTSEYYFTGKWYTTATYDEGTEFTADTIVTKDNITIYSQWVKKAKLSFDISNASVTYSLDIDGQITGDTKSSDINYFFREEAIITI
ncbi:MAG: InlB B-repeat-containing protein, partial [Clostridia bacterium]|nr:InlB B-repeat-containing protein [Clostridia bacterium]